ncbi:hypothetical protein C8Q78DRAFT_279840 [Trametes maxima]|nr:hypothetical protein C8Q78DRAFT_279840 [Trametes maxima]
MVRLVKRRSVPHSRTKVSIYSLPIELLVEIFRLYEEEAASHHGTPSYEFDPELGVDSLRRKKSRNSCHWLQLMLVCRAWRELGVSTPFLWTSIEVYGNLAWFELALSRSKRMQITLTFHDLQSAIQAATSEPLLSNVHRLHGLYFPPLYPEDSPAAIIAFASLFRSPMPRLRQLVMPVVPPRPDVRAWRKQMKHSWIDFAESHLPGLRHLRLSYATVRWNQDALSRLQTLELSACVADIAFGLSPLDCFLDVLNGCHLLEKLSLLDGFVSSTLCEEPPTTSQVAPPERTIKLPKLRSFRISDDPAVISWLLAHLELTPGLKVDVVGYFDDIDAIPEAPFSSLLPTDGPDVPRVPLRDPRHAVVALHDDVCDIEILGATSTVLKLSLQLRLPTLEHGWTAYLTEGMMEFWDLLNGSPIEALTVCGDWAWAQDPHLWHEFLNGFPRVKELYLIGRGYPAMLFQALQIEDTSLVTASDPGEALVCPRLTKIVVKFADWDEALNGVILEYLRARASRGLRKLTLLRLILNCSGGRKGAFLKSIGKDEEELNELTEEFQYTDAGAIDGSVGDSQVAKEAVHAYYYYYGHYPDFI